jgi:hypothetical protein
MSKKHKKAGKGSEDFGPTLSYAAEYRIIRHDLLRVVMLNAVYLACVLAIYYSNLKSGYLEKWFDKLLHF